MRTEAGKKWNGEREAWRKELEITALPCSTIITKMSTFRNHRMTVLQYSWLLHL